MSVEAIPRAVAPAGPFTGRTLADISNDLRLGRTTSVELVEFFLAAVDAPPFCDLNAFAFIDARGARAAAQEADRLRAAGVVTGPLHGIPVGVKDMIDVAGMPTRAGSAHFSARGPARADAACVRQLRRAGAVIVGKTTTHEFAYGPTGDRSADGPSRNPRDLTRISGGSSGGSAAAVAAGLIPLALGTDTGGSVRIPAALCGVSGFKPAYGAIDTQGVFPLAPSLDHVGVIARTARDCFVVARELSAASRAAGGPGQPDDGSDPPDRFGSGARVAWLNPPTTVDAEVAGTARAALERMKVPTADAPWPDAQAWRDLGSAFTAIQGREVSSVHADRLVGAPELFDPEVLRRLAAAARVGDADAAAARGDRAALLAAARQLFARVDVVTLPTVPIVAPPLGAREVIVGGRVVDVREALLSLTSMWNLLGLPTFSVPVGTVGGLPVGLQLVAAPGKEALAVELAARLEA